MCIRETWQGQLCVNTYQRHSHSLDHGDRVGTLDWRYVVLTLNEYRAWRVVDVDGQVKWDVEEEDTTTTGSPWCHLDSGSGDTHGSNHGTAISLGYALLAFGMGVYIYILYKASRWQTNAHETEQWSLQTPL
jgi:hypothetical protein